jgi:hypothetical protein
LYTSDNVESNTTATPNLAILLTPSTMVAGSSSNTSKIVLPAAAPAGGAVVTLNSSSTAAAVPASVVVPAGSTWMTFGIVAASVSAPTSAIITATYNGSSATADLKTIPVAISAVQLPQTWLISGQSMAVEIVLTAIAQSDLSVRMFSSHPALIPVPDPVIVPAGSSSVVVTLTAPPFGTQTATGVEITAAVNGSYKVALISLKPLTVSTFGMSPGSVAGGSPATGTVTLTGPAPAAGAVVALASSDASIGSVPASITVPQGGTTASFPVTTSALSTAASVTISATFNGPAKTAVLNVLPVQLSAIAVTPVTLVGSVNGSGTVTLNGAAGTDTVVALSSSKTAPASVPSTANITAGEKSI